MNTKVKHVLTTNKTYFGYTTSEIFGILLMIIPAVLCITMGKQFHWELFGYELPWGKGRNVTIRPEIYSMTIAVILYLGLILRFNLFNNYNLMTSIISCIRTFLNCWVLAAMINVVVPTSNAKTKFLESLLLPENWRFILIVITAILSWLGMRTIAGLGWFATVLICLTNMGAIAKVAKMQGALFILLAFISVLLQVKDLITLREFITDFTGDISPLIGTIQGDMHSAAEGAPRKIGRAATATKPLAEKAYKAFRDSIEKKED